MSRTYSFFVGVDWATQKHSVCVANSLGERVKELEVAHSGPGLEQLSELLLGLCEGHPEQVALSIEVPRGAVVEGLLERGFHVYSVNPKQLDRFRDRHTVAGAKDDRLDSFVLADALRTDLKLFRKLTVDDPLTLQLREATRTADDLKEEFLRLANQLRDLLLRYFPALLALCPAADDAWVWRVLELGSTPLQAAKLSRRKLAKLLHDHRIRRITPEELRAALIQKPLPVAKGVMEAASSHVLLILPRLRLVSEQRRQVDRQLEQFLAQLAGQEDEPREKREHRDAEILLSLPGVGNRVASTMLAEAAKPLAERDYDTLRALCGQAPVTKQSGKRCHVVRRQACSHPLREAVYHWSRVASQVDPKAKARYADLRGRGHSHGRALRGVGDRLLNILVGMLKNRSLYDPARGLPPAITKAA